MVRAALLLCLLADTVQALGLDGQLRLYSAINQPLNAELALHLAPGETTDEVRVGLADRATYQRLGLFFHEGLPPLSFVVAPDVAGRPVIRITSRVPMREPAVELVLDVRWGGGRILKPYALLLDPPELFTPPMAVAVPEPAAERAADSAPVRAVPVLTHYGPVQRGETLSQIAQRLKPAGVSTPQMTVALFEANPHAFIGGNMNRLRWGTTLYMPTHAAIAERSRGAAGKVMLDQLQALQPARSVEAAPPASAPALQILTPTAPDAAKGRLKERLAEVRRLNEVIEVENEALRQRLGNLEQQARRMAEQVLTMPVSSPVTADAADAADAVDTADAADTSDVVDAVVPQEAAVATIDATAPSPQDGWRDPARWVVMLAVLLGLSLAVLGWLLWRRRRRWDYRDLALAVREEAEIKDRARHAALEQARQRRQHQ